MSKLSIHPIPLQGGYNIETYPMVDNRGIFARFFCRNELSELLGDKNIVNVNYSNTILKGAVRGLHFQTPPYAEIKLVRCIKGTVFDVIVDIRKNSSTFLSLSPLA